jgi:hypothetical protein
MEKHMADTEKPLGWYIVGEQNNYYIVEIVKKYISPTDEMSAEHAAGFTFVRELFHAGTPVHAVRITEEQAIASSGHKLACKP